MTDALGNVTDTYTYEAFGELTDHIGSTENKYLFTGEQHDPNAGFYYLRARYYGPGLGRFISSDPFPGRMTEPLSLHKYLYANGDPLNRTDPSGLMSLQELSAAQEIQQALINIGGRIRFMLDVYDKAATMVDIVANLRQLFQVVQSGNVNAVFASAWNPAQVARINFSDAMLSLRINLPKIIGIGFGNWGVGYVKSRNRGHRMSAYYLYMPTFGALSPNMELNTHIKINGIPLKLSFWDIQGRTGRLCGVGVHMGSERPLFRMDFHTPNPGHGSRSGLGV